MNYVLVHARAGGDHEFVLLVKKNKPEWQAGRLNLCGGRIEPFDESPVAAAIRELKEESGLDPYGDAKLCGEIVALDCSIYCVTVPVLLRELKPRPEETEEVSWWHWSHVKDDPRLMPNLRAIVPMLHMGIADWQLIDRGFADQGFHEIAIQFQITPFRGNEPSC